MQSQKCRLSFPNAPHLSIDGAAAPCFKPSRPDDLRDFLPALRNGQIASRAMGHLGAVYQNRYNAQASNVAPCSADALATGSARALDNMRHILS